MTTTDAGIGEASSLPHCTCGCGVAAALNPAPRSASRHLSLLPVIALVLLPKCPLCLAAYLGIAGSIAADSWLPAVWGLPIGTALLAWALGALLLRAHRSRDYRPPLLGLTGAATLLGGKLAVDSALLLYAGAVMVVGASIWSVRQARIKS